MKKLMALFLCLSVMIPYAATAAEYTCQQVDYPIVVNGEHLDTGELPVLNLNGSTYIPLRKIGEGSGLIVEWDSENKKVYIDNFDSELAKMLSLSINILDETWECGSACSTAIKYCIDAASYKREGNQSTCIEYLTKYRDEFIPDRVFDLRQSVEFMKSHPQYEAYKEMIGYDPEACLSNTINAQNHLNTIINGAINFLSGVYTESYYYSLYDQNIDLVYNYRSEACKDVSKRYELKNILYKGYQW